MRPDQPLVVTAGEPAGIGPELCNALADSAYAQDVVIIGDKSQISSDLRVIDTPYPARLIAGKPDPANSRTLLDGLTLAVKGCIDGEFSGLVTLPVAKSVIADAGIPFTGHTELLAKLTNTALPVMMLVAGELRVALASTHIPLSAVPGYISKERLRGVIEILASDLRSKFRISDPEIIVCGLNPHAGEGGHLGHEDRDVIAPVVDELSARGLRVRGPLPADTAFTPAAGNKDAVLAMYHDQGLPVLKYAGFGHSVNVTLGLPIVRTSVDHGTAFDIAGRGKADTGSLFAAIELAAKLAGK
ncbi:MAG: 4-hydroxythreonine-4-phosphate dehydrogenase PdxA [Gammaproteobacteria bacterium]|nr:4-hydroxythreonine-4-phosphate dehydrogenase PdxA [Gammaproteobacteria bacterium]MBT8109183.1 4-hydroxythreonine-4-phosphate dehydrogenase PdxA [Gammaproteobacteria bacterium]NND48229.1 4-hydroxythreonine-4-phosphate dehydrogenase PdxA [Woeseiaceae bacterium]NNL43886.1 4-hydroxythreonine-4-phosphate dehydrogenase PdxA [Woeseiaceae bacterium]